MRKKEKEVTDKGDPSFTPEEMGEWILDMNPRFYISAGSMDQHHGLFFESYLHRNGMKQVKSEHTTEIKNSEMYQNLMSQFLCGRIRLPAGTIDPKTGFAQDTELVKELLTLQATLRSKYVVSVEAPQRNGCHDDLSDAFARAVWLCTKYIEGGGAAGPRLSSSTPVASSHRVSISKEMMKMDLKRSAGPRTMNGMRYRGPSGFGGR